MLVLFLIVMVRNKPHQLDGKALCISLIFGLAFNGQLILNIFVTMIFVSSLFECGKVAPLKLICYWFIEVCKCKSRLYNFEEQDGWGKCKICMTVLTWLS